MSGDVLAIKPTNVNVINFICEHIYLEKYAVISGIYKVPGYFGNLHITCPLKYVDHFRQHDKFPGHASLRMQTPGSENYQNKKALSCIMLGHDIKYGLNYIQFLIYI